MGLRAPVREAHTMQADTRLTGLSRRIGLFIVLALLFSQHLPLFGAAAQGEGEEAPTQEAVAEVPTTGARRPGPVILASSRIEAPERQAVGAGFAPVEMQVDKIGIDAPIEIGTITDGAMQDPTGPWVVSWYEALSQVGKGDNVVMAGHVDYWNTGPNGTAGPAIFWDLKTLAPGDVIRVMGENDQVVEYTVEWLRDFEVATELTPEVIQNDIVGDTGQESLTLITCGGPFDPATGEYLRRTVLRANQI